MSFQEDLIKEKIVETIFFQMFAETEKYHIYSFESNNTPWDIRHLGHHKDIENILKHLRKTPDFVVVPKEKDEVYLVEIKYRQEYNNSELQQIARELHDEWEYSWLFMASPFHFYFDSCWNIMNSGGHMDFLPYAWVPKDLHEKYRTLLNQFIK